MKLSEILNVTGKTILVRIVKEDSESYLTGKKLSKEPLLNNEENAKKLTKWSNCDVTYISTMPWIEEGNYISVLNIYVKDEE
jgi:hypothetical protein